MKDGTDTNSTKPINIIEQKHMDEVFRTIVDYSPQALAISQDFRFIFVNNAFTELSGFTTDELLNFTLPITAFRNIVNAYSSWVIGLYDIICYKYRKRRI